MLLSNEDVSDAFKNARVSSEHAPILCYIIEDVAVAAMRLTFGWAGSPGFWGVISCAE